MAPIFHEKSLTMGLIFKMGTFFGKIPKHGYLSLENMGTFLWKNYPWTWVWVPSCQWHIPDQFKSEYPPPGSIPREAWFLWPIIISLCHNFFLCQIFQNTPNFVNWAHLVWDRNPLIDTPILTKSTLKPKLSIPVYHQPVRILGLAFISICLLTYYMKHPRLRLSELILQKPSGGQVPGGRYSEWYSNSLGKWWRHLTMLWYRHEVTVPNKLTRAWTWWIG